LDNCWKDNKSRWIMCFWSLLIAREVFEEIQVSFMLVGHTHDDIDASFGRWSMKLRENDYPTIPLLMKSYMDLDEDPVIPGLIEEVPNFKEFVKPYISDDTLIGHTKGRQFLFYKGENGNPLMQYKLRCTDEKWLPVEGIQLWKVDSQGMASLPSGVPKAVMPRPMKGHDDIVKGLNGYIQYWTLEGQRDVTGVYKSQYGQCIEYWSGVRDALLNPDMEACDTLFLGFWPRTRQSLEVRGMQPCGTMSGAQCGGEEHYIGPRSQRPAPVYRIDRDCRIGHFVLVRPAEDSSASIWLGQAQSSPVVTPTNSNYERIQVQWYKPCERRGLQSNPYKNWDTAELFKWECDTRYGVQWTSTKSILTSWKSRRLSRTETVVIPKKQITTALENIATSISAIPNAPAEASDSDSD
jgi:hypothetical protein